MIVLSLIPDGYFKTNSGICLNYLIFFDPGLSTSEVWDYNRLDGPNSLEEFVNKQKQTDNS